MTEAAIILMPILANGFFSGAEIALVSVRKTRLVELVPKSLALRSAERYAIAATRDTGDNPTTSMMSSRRCSQRRATGASTIRVWNGPSRRSLSS